MKVLSRVLMLLWNYKLFLEVLLDRKRYRIKILKPLNRVLKENESRRERSTLAFEDASMPLVVVGMFSNFGKPILVYTKKLKGDYIGKDGYVYHRTWFE